MREELPICSMYKFVMNRRQFRRFMQLTPYIGDTPELLEVAMGYKQIDIKLFQTINDDVMELRDSDGRPFLRIMMGHGRARTVAQMADYVTFKNVDLTRSSSLTEQPLLRHWRLFSYILPKGIRDESFEPHFNELKQDYLETRRLRGKGAKRWLVIAFTLRTIWMVLDCLRLAFLRHVLRVLPKPWRKYWTG